MCDATSLSYWKALDGGEIVAIGIHEDCLMRCPVSGWLLAGRIIRHVWTKAGGHVVVKQNKPIYIYTPIYIYICIYVYVYIYIDRHAHPDLAADRSGTRWVGVTPHMSTRRHWSE